jgi:hypothetical protein
MRWRQPRGLDEAGHARREVVQDQDVTCGACMAWATRKLRDGQDEESHLREVQVNVGGPGSPLPRHRHVRGRFCGVERGNECARRRERRGHGPGAGGPDRSSPPSRASGRSSRLCGVLGLPERLGHSVKLLSISRNTAGEGAWAPDPVSRSGRSCTAQAIWWRFPAWVAAVLTAAAITSAGRLGSMPATTSVTISIGSDPPVSPVPGLHLLHRGCP